MKKAVVCIFILIVGMGIAAGLCIFFNAQTPVLEYGQAFSAETADHLYAIGELQKINDSGRYDFSFHCDPSVGPLVLVIADTGSLRVAWNTEPVFSITSSDPYTRVHFVTLVPAENGFNTLSFFRQNSERESRKLLSGPEYNIKLLIGTENCVQTTNTFYLSLETFTMGIFAMLILCSLVLFIVRPNEQYLIALLFVSLVTMAVSIIDHRAGQLGITLSAFTAFRSSLFIAPSVLTTAIVFYLLGDQRGEWHHPLFSLRYSFLATLAIVFIQFFCPYNFNYILRVVLLILLFPVFCRAAQNHVDGTLLLSFGYGLAEGARIFIYLLNTPSVWHSGAPAILLRLTQIGYLIQLVFCLIVVLKRFAQKFNEADELILSLDQKVADRTQALQKASREMQRAKESEHEVMINILHDLRTPIFHIQGCLDMLRSTDEEQHSLIEKLHERVEYLQSLTESSFLAAKVKDGQISFHFHETDLVPLCQYAIDSSKTAMEKRHLSLNAVLPSTLSTSTDGLRYRQVVENLLSNAVQYAPENTEIDLTLFSGKNDICLTVKNRSEDMTEELLLRIFDRFTHGASRDSTGLGLFIARKLSTGLGGSLNASLDQGIITFTFIIPHQINREIAQQ